MNRACLLAAAVLGFACGSSSSPQTSFSSTLAGTNEVPASGSAATGSATFTVSGTTVNYTVTFSGLSGNPTASHIHIGTATTASGSVVVPFTGLPAATSGTWSGSFTSADVKPQTSPVVNNLDDLLAQMRAGNTYVNVHSAAHPGGEIRGEIH